MLYKINLAFICLILLLGSPPLKASKESKAIPKKLSSSVNDPSVKIKKDSNTQTILVMGLKSSQIDKAVIDSLSAVLVKEINDHPQYSAISKNEISGMLAAEAMKEAMDCATDSCLMEIAGAFGAEKIISGNIGKLEGSLIVNLEIMNTLRAIVEARVNYNWKGNISDLSDLVKVAAQSLILTKTEQKPTTIVLSRAQKGARILVDGRESGKTPENIKNINLGPHKLVLQLDGYHDFEGHFLAKNGDTTIIEAPMRKIEIPIYQKWWFWTAVGVGFLGVTAV